MRPKSRTESKWQREFDDYKNRGNRRLLKKVVKKIRRNNNKLESTKGGCDETTI